MLTRELPHDRVQRQRGERRANWFYVLRSDDELARCNPLQLLEQQLRKQLAVGARLDGRGAEVAGRGIEHGKTASPALSRAGDRDRRHRDFALARDS